jgi:hypothetical protein
MELLGRPYDLAGFTSAIILAMIALLIGYEAIARFLVPVPIHFGEAIPIAVVSVVTHAVQRTPLSIMRSSEVSRFQRPVAHHGGPPPAHSRRVTTSRTQAGTNWKLIQIMAYHPLQPIQLGIRLAGI